MNPLCFSSLALSLASIALADPLSAPPRFTVTAYNAGGQEIPLDCGIGNPNGQCPDFGSEPMPSQYTIYLRSDTGSVALIRATDLGSARSVRSRDRGEEH